MRVGTGWFTRTVAKGTSSAAGDVATMSYEQARDELVSVVGRLEGGAESLEESLALWERGEALAARCQQWLDGARERLAAARGSDPAAGASADDEDDDDDEDRGAEG